MTFKILFVHGGTLQQAGTESYMMSVFRNIDTSRYHIDFLVFGTESGYYDMEVLEANSKIYRVPLNVNLLDISNLNSIRHHLKDENYDIVHAHMNALNQPVLAFFKKLGVPTLISHSHGTQHFVNSEALSIIQDGLKKRIVEVTPHLLA